MSAKLRTLMEQAYAIIGDSTPVRADCGKLCGKACCDGDEDIGMLLFPGEAVMLSRIPYFEVSRIDYMDEKTWFLACNSPCDRDLRPLACRIFPLAPHVDEQGHVTALPDPRGKRMCPLADGKYLDKSFRRRVEKAFQLLAGDPKMLAFMRLLSEELEDLRKLVW